MNLPQAPREIIELLKKGMVIPAHPLALTSERKLDERHQRALTRYYLAAGAGGIAVAVHTTQFEIRLPKIGLFKPVLEIAGEEIDAFVKKTKKTIVKIAGAIGRTEQAVKEAQLASALGYHAVLLGLSAFKNDPNKVILDHCQKVAENMPLIGFYLQTAVGGRKLDLDFWRAFAKIDNVVAIKIAPFNRYQTLDVVRGVAESGRADKIALYTGNDDTILVDLLTDYTIRIGSMKVAQRMVGGLLGHWAVWTNSTVKLFNQIQAIQENLDFQMMLNLAVQITDCNAAFFDAANNFAGCITGIHEVLRRQGLLEGIWTLSKNETLSPGQKEEIDRVYKAYPALNDDAFVAENLDKWLA